MRKFDLLVIGSGPAGQSAAIQASQLGKSAAIIEKNTRVGGVCLHTGTIPSKTLREAVLYLTGYRMRGLYGRGYRLKRDLTVDDLMQRLQITLTHEVDVMQQQLSRNGVTVIEGSASFLDAHRVAVRYTRGDVTEVQADKILIATGTRPLRPAQFPFDGSTVLDSDDVLQIKCLPRRLTVIGGGVIGVEYASIFAALDIKVTLTDGRPELLDFLDRELVEEFSHYLRKQSVNLFLGEKVEQAEQRDDGRVMLQMDSGKQILSDMVLVAAGRTGSTAGLNLDKVGLTPDDRGRILVNDHYQTTTSNIYAAGDVIGFPSLASTSMEQGRLAACHAFDRPATSHPESFPFAIYAVPEISMVGATEQELVKKKIPYQTGKAYLRETARGQIMGLEEGFLKILYSQEDRKILGVHILGEGSSELIHIGQAILSLGGTVDYFLENIFNFPTLAEAYKIAALDAWNQEAALPPRFACPLPGAPRGDEGEWDSDHLENSEAGQPAEGEPAPMGGDPAAGTDPA